MQEDHPTSATYFCRCSVVFFELFHYYLVSLLPSGPSLLETTFCKNVFPYCMLKLHASLSHVLLTSQRKNGLKDACTQSKLNQ